MGAHYEFRAQSYAMWCAERSSTGTGQSRVQSVCYSQDAAGGKGALQTQVNVLEEQQESLYLQVQTAAMVQVCPQSIRSSICYMANALRRVKQKMNCCAESA